MFNEFKFFSQIWTICTSNVHNFPLNFDEIIYSTNLNFSTNLNDIVECTISWKFNGKICTLDIQKVWIREKNWIRRIYKIVEIQRKIEYIRWTNSPNTWKNLNSLNIRYCPVFAWGLNPTGHSKEWSSSSSQVGALISCHSFNHLFWPTFFLCLDEGHPTFSISSVYPLGDYCISGIHVLHGFVQDIDPHLWIILVDREEELSRLQPVGECSDENLVVGFVN